MDKIFITSFHLSILQLTYWK